MRANNVHVPGNWSEAYLIPLTTDDGSTECDADGFVEATNDTNNIHVPSNRSEPYLIPLTTDDGSTERDADGFVEATNDISNGKSSIMIEIILIQNRLRTQLVPLLDHYWVV